MRVNVTKWYMDLVGDNGDAFIGYHAEVRWLGLSLAYAGVLVGLAGEGRDRHRVTLRASTAPAPTIRGGAIEWSEPRLGVTGVWRSSDHADDRVLLDDPDLTVGWHCRAPAAEASVCLPGGRLEGRGYVETLRLRGDVRRLPVNVLRWGRWVADAGVPGVETAGDAARSLVWIGWEGPREMTLVLVDGRPVTDAKIGEASVAVEGRELVIDRERTLRDGALGETVGHRLPGVCRPLLGGIAAWRETKWLARGELRGAAGGRGPRGWVIHERVNL